MTYLRLAYVAIVVTVLLGATASVFAQLPPHTPGTICVTTAFWCWAQPPGSPGIACYCPTPQGPVRGQLR